MKNLEYGRDEAGLFFQYKKFYARFGGTIWLLYVEAGRLFSLTIWDKAS